MRQLAPQNCQRRTEHDGGAGAIVGAQAGARIVRAHKCAVDHRFAAQADRHSVHVGHQQPARARSVPGSLKIKLPTSPGIGVRW